MALQSKLEVLYEDNHLLVVNKPAGLPTVGVEPERASLAKLAKEYIRRRYNKPGNVYLGVMSRLDSPVSGVVVLARTSKAAARLTEQFRSRTVQKIYWAIVRGPVPPADEWIDHLAKNERLRRVEVVALNAAGAQRAELSFRRLAKLSLGDLVEVELATGRKHQIRVQFAAHGHPVVGDRQYGSPTSFPAGIALHARRLNIQHPVQGVELEFIAPVPHYWPELPDQA